MDLRFVAPELRQLDVITTEIIVVPVSELDRPPQGTTGLIDYRLGGQISRLIAQNTVSGSVGQIHLIPGRPRLPFDRVLLLGQGDPAQFNVQIYTRVVEQLLGTLQHLGARRAVVELPGRRDGSISPSDAVEILLELTKDNPWFDTWTLIEPLSAQRAMGELLRRDQRQKWVLGPSG
jgi:hypothetical protein